MSRSTRTFRDILADLPSMDLDTVQSEVATELAGERRRAVIHRLASRAAKLAGDAAYQEILSRYNTSSQE